MDSIYTIRPGSAPLNSQLGFMAYACIVDNNTAQYVYIPTAQQRVPPYTPGYVVTFPSGTTQAQAQFTPPDGVISPPNNPAESAVLRYVTAQLPSSPQLSFSPGTPQQTLFSTTVPAATGDSVVTVPVPQGVQAVAVAVFETSGIFPPAPARIIVQGTQTGITYIDTTNLLGPSAGASSGYDVALLLGAADTSMKVTYGGTVSTRQTKLWLIGIYDLASVDVQGASGSAVQIVGDPGASNYAPVGVYGPGYPLSNPVPMLPFGGSVASFTDAIGANSDGPAHAIALNSNALIGVFMSGNTAAAFANVSVRSAGGVELCKFVSPVVAGGITAPIWMPTFGTTQPGSTFHFHNNDTVNAVNVFGYYVSN